MRRTTMIEDVQFRSDLIDMIPQLRAVALVLLADNDAATALTHEAVLRALRDSGNDQLKADNFKAWCLQRLHEVYAAIPHPRHPTNCIGSTADSGCDDAFRDAFWQLSPSDREMLVLMRDPELTPTDIARIRGCSVAQAKRLATRARNALKAHLNASADGSARPWHAHSSREASRDS